MPQPPRPGQPNAPTERQSTMIEGSSGSALPDRRSAGGPPIERSGTIIESDEDGQHAVPFVARGLPHGAGSEPHPVVPMIPRAGRSVSPYRPMARPPVAMLTVYDDGKMEGEVIRIRDTRFTIGRTEGDLRIPIDGLISARATLRSPASKSAACIAG